MDVDGISVSLEIESDDTVNVTVSWEAPTYDVVWLLNALTHVCSLTMHIYVIQDNDVAVPEIVGFELMLFDPEDPENVTTHTTVIPPSTNTFSFSFTAAYDDVYIITIVTVNEIGISPAFNESIGIYV